MRSTNAYALLCLLSIQPMNGYTMKRWVDKVLSHFWKTSYGQIYPTMERFLKDGLVTVEKRQSDKGPASKYYHITQKGIDELKDWLKEDTPDFNYRDEALLKSYFSALLPIETVIEKAENSVEFQQELLDNYTNDIEDMEEVTDPTRAQLMMYLSVKKGIYLNEARLKWAKDCVRLLKWFDQKEKMKEQKDED